MQKNLKGKIITVVGPSGVGKDTLIQNAKKFFPFIFQKGLLQD
jgi:ribose 1,5-bisphosphokinase PhnN